MSGKLFLQIVGLMVIYLALYWVLLLVRDWQTQAAYNARVEQIKADTDNRMRDIRDQYRAR